MLVLCIRVIIKLIYILLLRHPWWNQLGPVFVHMVTPFELPEQLCRESCCMYLWSVVVVIPLPQCKSYSYHPLIQGILKQNLKPTNILNCLAECGQPFCSNYSQNKLPDSMLVPLPVAHPYTVFYTVVEHYFFYNICTITSRHANPTVTARYNTWLSI